MDDILKNDFPVYELPAAYHFDSEALNLFVNTIFYEVTGDKGYMELLETSFTSFDELVSTTKELYRLTKDALQLLNDVYARFDNEVREDRNIVFNMFRTWLKVENDYYESIIKTAEALTGSKDFINQQIKTGKYKGLSYIVALFAENSEQDDIISLLTSVPLANGTSYAPINKPHSYVMPNSKPVNQYFSIQDMLTTIEPNGQYTFLPLNDNDNQTELVVRNESKNKKEVVDIVSLTYLGDLDGKAARIKAFDQSVYNAIASLLAAGNNTFTLEDVYKTMTQKTKATQKQLDRIKNSIDKFAGTKIRLDITEEIEAKMLVIDGEHIKSSIIEDNLLHFRTLTITTESGKTKTAIEILTTPILYSYSMIKKQVITIPVDLLGLPVRVSEESISIRDYLLREINQIKKGYRNNHVINYDNLLRYIGVDKDTVSRTEKSRITATICEMLNTWRDKKHIKDYRIKNGARNKVNGFEIITD